MTIEVINDHAARAIGRLIHELKDSVSHQGVLNALGTQVQELEDAFQPLLALLVIDTSSNVQLDLIGAILGAPREGRDDTRYKLRLKAQIIINQSSGTLQEIHDVLSLAIPGSNPDVQDIGEAAALASMYGVLIADPTETQKLVRETKAAGVTMQVYYQPASDALTFCFDTGPGLGFGDSGVPATGGQLAGQI